jgi:prepilin-type N-terminal cleavage/methylation domain-containing protein
MHETRAGAAEADRRAAGFSLVEILVVVAIAAVILAIAIPNVAGVMESNKLQTSTSMLASKLAEARINALKRNRATWLRVDAPRGRVQVQTSGPGGTTLDIGGMGLLPSGVGFVEPAPQIQFDSVGRPTNPPPRTLTVEIVSTRARRSVTVSPAGTVTRQ